MTNPTTKEVNAKEVVKALRWLAKETEPVFAAEQLREAADLIESLQAEVGAAHTREDAAYAALAESQRRADAAVEDLCGACESLARATGQGWEDSCAACKWYGVQAGEESK